MKKQQTKLIPQEDWTEQEQCVMYNEKRLEYHRKWRKNNPEKWEEYRKRYYDKNKEKLRNYWADRWRNDPEWREKRFQKKLEWQRNFKRLFIAYCSRPDIRIRLHNGETKDDILKEYKELKRKNKQIKKQNQLCKKLD